MAIMNSKILLYVITLISTLVTHAQENTTLPTTGIPKVELNIPKEHIAIFDKFYHLA